MSSFLKSGRLPFVEVGPSASTLRRYRYNYDIHARRDTFIPEEVVITIKSKDPTLPHYGLEMNATIDQIGDLAEAFTELHKYLKPKGE